MAADVYLQIDGFKLCSDEVDIRAKHVQSPTKRFGGRCAGFTARAAAQGACQRPFAGANLESGSFSC